MKHCCEEKRALSGKFQESILWKVVIFPPTFLLQALLGFLAACPIGPRSSHWGGVPQVQVGLAHKHRETHETRKGGNTETQELEHNVLALPSRGQLQLGVSSLLTSKWKTTLWGGKVKKTSKRGTKNNLVMKNPLMRRKGELTSKKRN